MKFQFKCLICFYNKCKKNSTVRLFCTAKQVYIRQALPSNVYIVPVQSVRVHYILLYSFKYVLQSLDKHYSA